MLADLVFLAGFALLAGWEIFLLFDLASAGKVRLLPRWAWAAACLLAIPLGGIAYLLIGRVWTRSAKQQAS